MVESKIPRPPIDSQRKKTSNHMHMIVIGSELPPISPKEDNGVQWTKIAAAAAVCSIWRFAVSVTDELPPAPQQEFGGIGRPTVHFGCSLIPTILLPTVTVESYLNY